ncbi:MAG: CRISPR-associated helicase Cas3' [Bacteroidales bacterium]|nr:CRISPR-associated helicase Cas3' [Bacteroidales bacterium]
MEPSTTIISHIRQTDMKIQSNEEHQQGVAERAERFAAEFGMGDYGRVLGLLHDKGKEKNAFQQHIIKESGKDPFIRVEGDYCHAYVGALLARKQYSALASLLAYPILGHHAGLYDYSDYNKVMDGKSIPTEVDPTEQDIPLSSLKLKSIKPFECNHIIRMLFSCLVDADRLDTEKFMNPEQASLREGKKTLQELAPLLEKHLADLKSSIREKHKENNTVNIVRNQVQEECRKKAVCESGFYSLTVPTGGGKTLSSLVWAMNHAIHHDKKRIVFAIPYTSIIVQTAQILREIFGAENVLEHHSNVSYESICDKDDKDEDKIAQQMKLATENWDYPIIVTTNVQLFESMYSNKPTPCRKLHNLCNSVLILDEVQTLPTDYLQPIVNALKTYQRLFGLSVLFTTASQPVLEGKHQGTIPRITLDGIDKVTEIIPDGLDLHNKLRRVNLHFDEHQSSYDEIAERIAQYDRVLCIVNSRRAAKEIFDRLPDEEYKYHLSRLMCPVHVRKTIADIIGKLRSPQKKIRVISTQLIEAGVDIDFPFVLRQEIGLDSVLQAAGRCNREGGDARGEVYVFSLNEEKEYPNSFMEKSNNARKRLSKDFDWLSPEAMTAYFLKLYQGYTETFDKVDIKKKLESPSYYLFKTIGEKFKLIDDKTRSVIVNYGDAERLVNQVKQEGVTYELMNALGQYTVNVSRSNFELLKDAFDKGERIPEGLFFLMNKGQYDDRTGVILKNMYIEDVYTK